MPKTRRTGRDTCCHHCAKNDTPACRAHGLPCPSHPDTCNGRIRGNERCLVCPHFEPKSQRQNNLAVGIDVRKRLTYSVEYAMQTL
jgi:hypothetical protein